MRRISIVLALVSSFAFVGTANALEVTETGSEELVLQWTDCADETLTAWIDRLGVTILYTAPTAIRAIKKARPELVVMADACFCEYTDHGHCGPLAQARGDKVVCQAPSTVPACATRVLSLGACPGAAPRATASRGIPYTTEVASSCGAESGVTNTISGSPLVLLFLRWRNRVKR